MDDWFSVIAAGCDLPASAVKELDDVGFVVIAGPVAPSQLSRLRAVYDAAVSAADPADFNSGRATTRGSDFVNPAAHFHAPYIYQPLPQPPFPAPPPPFPPTPPPPPPA